MSTRNRVNERTGAGQRGFSLLEMIVVLAIFLIVVGAVFGLLDTSQQRYRAEQEFLETFQSARVGMDLLAREIRTAGFPPPYTFPGPAGFLPPSYPVAWPTWLNPTVAAPDEQRRFAIAFLGAPVQNCTVGGTCLIPGPTTLSMEMDQDPENPTCPNQVEVVDYAIVGPNPQGLFTLMRRATSKPGSAAFNAASCLPLRAAGVPFAPFVENVLPNPGGTPLFQYTCDPAVAVCTPQFIRDVTITLTVRSARPDPRMRQFRQITLQTIVRRLNPYQ